MGRLRCALIAVLAGGFGAFDAGAASTTEWTTVGGSPDHAGYYPGLLGTTPFAQLWEYTPGPEGFTRPAVVAEDRVFATGSTGYSCYALALDCRTGAEAWVKESVPGAYDAPSYHGGTLIHAVRPWSLPKPAPAPELRALHAGNGSRAWSAAATLDDFGGGGAPLASDLGVFLASDRDSYSTKVQGFEPVTGAARFLATIGSPGLRWTPGQHANRLFAFIGSGFSELDPQTGNALWTLGTGPADTWTPERVVAFESGCGYFVHDFGGGLGSELVCVDLDARVVRWRVPDGKLTGKPAVAGGVVFALSGSKVRRFSATNGTALGNYSTQDRFDLEGAPVVSDDLVVASSEFHQTFLISRVTGEVIQTLSFAGSAAVANGVLYFTCGDRKIRAYGRPPGGNRAPVAAALSVTGPEDTALPLTLSATDADGHAVSFVVRSLPAVGALYQSVDGVAVGDPITRVPAWVQNPGGSLIYKAPRDVNGPANFTYTAHDAWSSSGVTAVSISVTAVADPPVAVPDLFVIPPGESVALLRPRLNDRDPDGGSFWVAGFTQPARGMLTPHGNGSFTYVPHADFVAGEDSFTYTIEDLTGGRGTATVTIRVDDRLGREWLTFGAAADRAGFVPVALGPGAIFSPVWNRKLTAAAHQVVVAGGRAFAAVSAWPDLVAMDAASGAAEWDKKLVEAYRLRPPAIHDGTLFLHGPAWSSRLYALAADDGSIRWTQVTDSSLQLAPAARGSTVFYPSYTSLFAAHTANGTRLFTAGGMATEGWTPALFGESAFTFERGKFTAWDQATGIALWNLNLGGNYTEGVFARTVACGGERAVLIHNAETYPSGGRELVCIDLANRTVAWSVAGNFTGTPALGHGAAFALRDGSRVAAYDLQTGAFLGNYVATGETGLRTQPILAGDAVIAYSSNRTHLFDLETRALRQTLAYGGEVSLAGSHLYIASADGFLRTFSVPDPYNAPPVAFGQSLETTEDLDVAIALAGSDADGDALGFAIVQLPAWGRLYQVGAGAGTRGAPILATPTRVTDPAGRVIYAPPEQLSGPGIGNFSYVASDARTSSLPVPVTVSVSPVNDPPQARADLRQALPGQTLSPLRERSNDWDPEGDTFSTVAFTQPARGRVTRNADGSLRYVAPEDGISGTDTFSYTIQDAGGAISQGVIRVELGSEPAGFWSMTGNGPDYTGYAPVSPEGGSWTLRWSTDRGGAAHPPVVAGGRVFGFVGGRMAAYDERTGAEQWVRNFDATSPPAFHSGALHTSIYFGMYDSALVAVDPLTGNTDVRYGWFYDPSHVAPVVDAQSAYFLDGYYSSVLAWDRISGDPRFEVNWVHEAPALHGGELYVNSDGALCALDRITGETRWSLWAGQWDFNWVSLPALTAAFSGNSAYLPAGDLCAIDLPSHSVRWRVPVPDLNGSPSVRDGVVYVVTRNRIQSYREWDGAPLLTFTPPPNVRLVRQAVVTDAWLVVSSDSTQSYVFDRATGNLLATLPRAGWISVADDQILIASDGSIAAYGPPAAVGFSPPGGAFAAPVSVTLGEPSSAGRVHFTTDGSTPGPDDPSVEPGGVVSVGSNCTLQAVRVDGSAVSRICRAIFTFQDTDGDGLADWWERDRFHDLTTAGAGSDFDRDGASDLAESGAGTDPRDPSDMLAVQETVMGPPGPARALVLSWSGKADRGYVVETGTGLTSWRALTPILPGIDGRMEQEVDAGADAGFFRVRATPLGVAVP